MVVSTVFEVVDGWVVEMAFASVEQSDSDWVVS